MHEHTTGPLFALLAVDHCDIMNSCPEDEPMTPSEECVDATTDESLLETNPIQSPLQVFAGMGGLALIAERLPMLYPDVIQQVRLKACYRHWHMHGHSPIGDKTMAICT